VRQSGGHCRGRKRKPGVGTTVTSYFPHGGRPGRHAGACGIRAIARRKRNDSAGRGTTSPSGSWPEKVLESHRYTVLAGGGMSPRRLPWEPTTPARSLLLERFVMPDLSGPDLMPAPRLRRPTSESFTCQGFSSYLTDASGSRHRARRIHPEAVHLRGPDVASTSDAGQPHGPGAQRSQVG